MCECIAFQEECSLSKPDKNASKQDKRILAQVLENALFKLDKLVNDCLLRTVYILFAKLDQNPIRALRRLGPLENDEPNQTVIGEEIEKFDIVLDQLIQVGSFAVSYASTAKRKCVGGHPILGRPRHLAPFYDASLFIYSEIESTKLLGLVRST